MTIHTVTINNIMVALVSVALILFVVALIVRGRWGLVSLSAGLFTGLAALAVVVNKDWLAAVDTTAASWADKHRTDRRGEFAAGIWEYIGTPLHVLTVALVCGTLFSLWRRSPIPLMLVVGGVGVGVAVEETLKATLHPHSFPSGHVTGTATLFGMIAVCLAAGDSRLAKAAVGLLVAQTVAFVAALAVYTGAHTVTEVLGGMVLGAAISALGAAVLDASTHRRAADRRKRVRTPARATDGGPPVSASPGHQEALGPGEITRPIPRL